MCSHKCTHTHAHVEVKNTFQNQFFFHYSGPGVQAQVVMFVGKHFSLLSQLEGSRSWYFWFWAVGDLQKRKHALLSAAGRVLIVILLTSLF